MYKNINFHNYNQKQNNLILNHYCLPQPKAQQKKSVSESKIQNKKIKKIIVFVIF